MTDEEPLGSAAEEAAKLADAVAAWAAGRSQQAGAQVGSVFGHAAAAWREVDEHTGHGEDCRYCPVCRTINAVRSSPEVQAHLAAALGSLVNAVESALTTTAQATDTARPSPKPRSDHSQHIDLGGSGDEGSPDEDPPGGGSAA